MTMPFDDLEELEDEANQTDTAEQENAPSDYEQELAQRAEELRSTSVALIHDSFGVKYINLTSLQEHGGDVTINRVLGVADLDAGSNAEYFVNGVSVGVHTAVQAGDEIMIVGKLTGGY